MPPMYAANKGREKLKTRQAKHKACRSGKTEVYKSAYYVYLLHVIIAQTLCSISFNPQNHHIINPF